MCQPLTNKKKRRLCHGTLPLLAEQWHMFGLLPWLWRMWCCFSWLVWLRLCSLSELWAPWPRLQLIHSKMKGLAAVDCLLNFRFLRLHYGISLVNNKVRRLVRTRCAIIASEGVQRRFSLCVWPLAAGVAVSRLCGWIAPWSRLCSPCPTSASSSPRSPSCESTTPPSATSKAARSMTSSWAQKIFSMRWTGRRSCEVLKRRLVTQTPFPVRGFLQLFTFLPSGFTRSPLTSLQAAQEKCTCFWARIILWNYY